MEEAGTCFIGAVFSNNNLVAVSTTARTHQGLTSWDLPIERCGHPYYDVCRRNRVNCGFMMPAENTAWMTEGDHDPPVVLPESGMTQSPETTHLAKEEYAILGEIEVDGF